MAKTFRKSEVKLVLTVAIRQLQIVVALFAGLTIIASFTKLAFGMFNFAAVEFGTTRAKVEADPDESAEVGKSGVADDSSFASPDLNYAVRDATSLKRALTQTRTRARQLEESEQQQSKTAASLKQEEARLSDVVGQRRRALQQTQETAQFLTAEQTRTLQTIDHLRTEKDDLERRVAALRVTANEAEQRRTRATAKQEEISTPQVIECVAGAVILTPQQVRIPTSELNDGQIASFAKKNGVYLLVRPSGFDSFVAARKIAQRTGVVVGYEPSRSGEER